MEERKSKGLKPYKYPEWVLSSKEMKQININKRYKIVVSFWETAKTPLADIRLRIDDIPCTAGFFLTPRSVMELISILERFLDMHPIMQENNES